MARGSVPKPAPEMDEEDVWRVRGIGRAAILSAAKSWRVGDLK